MKIQIRPVLATLVLLSTLSLQPATSFAQGTAFTYQGRLNDGTVPANGTYHLRFALFDALTVGNQVGSPLTNAPVSVSNGLFTVALDFGANFPGTNRWLEIAVRTNGSGAFATLIPRQPITATPYAITAGNLSGALPSASLSGTYANAVTLNNGANSFSGNGAGLTALNASQLGSGTVPAAALNNAWRIGGNAGTTPGTQFLGTTDNLPMEFKVNGTRALRLEPNPNVPNVIGGYFDNLVSNGVYGATIAGGGGGYGRNTVGGNFATVGGGSANTSSGSEATVGGGDHNTSSGSEATVGGGDHNTSSGSEATVSGGAYNTSSSNNATVGGGFNNTSSGSEATVNGGAHNTSSDFAATVGGGFNNTSSGSVATLSGGEGNIVSGDHATVGGGLQNNNGGYIGTISGGFQNINSGYISTISGGSQNTGTGDYSTIPGGLLNVASHHAFAAGRRAKANHQGAFVWADSQDADFSSTANNQFLIRAAGGVGLNKNNPATALDVNGTVTATSFNGNGAGLTSLNAANLAGSVPSAALTSVPAGNLSGTIADARLSANVALLNANQTFTGSNTIAPSVSLSFGSQVRQMLNLWGTQYGIGVQSSTVYFRTDNASGLENGFAWYKGGIHNNAAHDAGGGTTMMTLNGSGLTVNGTFVSSSDRNVKQDFAEVNSRTVLEKVAQLPIQTWAYKNDPNTKHLGPVAQDFYAAFNVGPDDKHIATVDESGVALAAIQGLNQKVEEKEARIRELSQKVDAQNSENAELKQRLESLEKIVLNQKLN